MDLGHHHLRVNGIGLHYVRQGGGFPLVLLHGWPEFWRVWRKVIEPLGQRYDVIAPDLRGFGASDKPAVPAQDGYRLEDHVRDLLALADRLGLERFGIVSHDVGAYVAQAFARIYPERLAGLFFFDCPYPGIGRRWAEADHLREIWYQSFHQLPWAAGLIGSSRANCELYVRHFLSHWAHDPNVFEDEDVEAWVDNFLEPGNLQGGFNWYIAANSARLELIRHGPPQLEPIKVPARVRWGASDKVLKAEWADRLGDYFSDYDFAVVDGAGHFVAYERPEFAVEEILDFFSAVV
jgi:pimeloyl-ACP methyl ester carboxylesterase